MGTEQGAGFDAAVGDLAVYPGQGVARVTAIEARDISGQRCEFLVLHRLEDDARILVPSDRVDDVGLRPVMAAEDAAQVWKILRDSEPSRPRPGIAWSRQFRQYQDKLREGGVFAIAEVLRDLLCLQQSKDLSFGERKLLESARGLLAQELAAVEERGADAVEAELRLESRTRECAQPADE